MNTAQVNSYQMAWRGETTGWTPEANDVNGVNLYGMRPLDVAAQAGNSSEFEAILRHPDFDPTINTRARYFAQVGRDMGDDGATQRYKNLQPLLAQLEALLH